MPTAKPARPADGIPAAVRSFEEPWSWSVARGTVRSQDRLLRIEGKSGETILEVISWIENRSRDADAIERLIACVNFCAGIPTELLNELNDSMAELPMGARMARP